MGQMEPLRAQLTSWSTLLTTNCALLAAMAVLRGLGRRSGRSGMAKRPRKSVRLMPRARYLRGRCVSGSVAHSRPGFNSTLLIGWSVVAGALQEKGERASEVQLRYTALRPRKQLLETPPRVGHCSQ